MIEWVLVFEWIGTILCLSGGLALAYKKIWGFHLNGVGDVFLIAFSIMAAKYGVLTLSLVYLFLNILGIYKWRKSDEN